MSRADMASEQRREDLSLLSCDGWAAATPLLPPVLQFHVTQQCGTEPPFNNQFWNNKKPDIHVDMVSGESLFASKIDWRPPQARED